MKKNALLRILLLLCTYLSVAQVTSTTIESIKLAEKRNIKIYVPEDYSSDKTYPLVVVLDADYLFDLTVGNAKFYAHKDKMPQCIILGIDQSQSRYEDCYYSPESGFPDKKGNAFFEFIAMELIPMVAKNYHLANFKAIIGHGITANFTNYFLFKKSPLFNAYIELSPSFAPLMESKVPKRLSELDQMVFYYIATANEDASENQQRIQVFHNQTKGYNNNHLHYYYNNFENADHYSVASFGIPIAFDQIFKVYKPISVKEYKEEILAHNGPVIEYLTDKYTTIETLFGFKKQVSLNDMMAIYAGAKKKEDLESIKELSKIAKDQYPNTMLGFFWEAEYLEHLGEPKKALRTYEKAFGMNEIDFATKDLALERIESLKADFGW